MVFCLVSVRHKLKCDLLLPIDDGTTTPAIVSSEPVRASVHL
jgi:hypothetical protein